MAKDNKKGLNKALDEKGKRDAENIMHGVKMIEQSIKISAMMNHFSGSDFSVLLTILATVFGDVIRALADACHITNEEALNKMMDCVKYYLDNPDETQSDLDFN